MHTKPHERLFFALALACIFLASSCGAPHRTKPLTSTPQTETTPAPSTSYFYGEVRLLSADGTKLYQQHHTLIKRALHPAKGTIEEEVYWDDKPNQISHHPTVLTQTDNPHIFSIQDPENAYGGTVTYQGSLWKWDRWTYDIRFLDGSGTIRGNGALTQNGGFRTHKEFVLPNGDLQIQIQESVSPISAQKFSTLHTSTPPWPSL